MKRILKAVGTLFGVAILLVLLVVGGYFLFRPKPPKAPESVTNLTEAEAYLEELVDYGTPPGVSLVVVKDGDIVHVRFNV